MKQLSQGQGLNPALIISTLLAITVSDFELFRMEMDSHVQEESRISLNVVCRLYLCLALGPFFLSNRKLITAAQRSSDQPPFFGMPFVFSD